MTGGRRLFLTVLAGARSCSKIALDGAPLRQSQPAPTKAKTFALGTRPRTSLLSCVPLASQELDATWARRNIFRRVTDEGEVDRGERFGIFRILWSGVRSSIRPWFAWHARAPAIFTRSPQLKCAEVTVRTTVASACQWRACCVQGRYPIRPPSTLRDGRCRNGRRLQHLLSANFNL